LLKNTGVKVVNVVLCAEVRHTECLVAESCSKEKLVVVRVGVVLSKMMSEVVTLLVL
jgi:hypothetical protein